MGTCGEAASLLYPSIFLSLTGMASTTKAPCCSYVQQVEFKGKSSDNTHTALNTKCLHQDLYSSNKALSRALRDDVSEEGIFEPSDGNVLVKPGEQHSKIREYKVQ